MKTFVADQAQVDLCGSNCCCRPATATPGMRDLLEIDYATWAAPIAAKGLGPSRFEVTNLGNVYGDHANAPHAPFLPLVVVSPAGVVMQALPATDPNGLMLTYAFVPFWHGENGTAELTSAGFLTYTPSAGFRGVERIFYTVTNGNESTVGEVAIRVNGPAPEVQFPAPTQTPGFEIDTAAADPRRFAYLLRVPFEVSPAVRYGDVFRLSVRQTAYDCDMNPFTHVSCYDFTITRC